MGMGRSDILTEDLRKVLLEIEYWLKDGYLEKTKIDITKLKGVSLQQHNMWMTSMNQTLVLVDNVLRKGYYTSDEKEVLNILRKGWIEEKSANIKV